MAALAAIMKIYFVFLLNQKANWLETWYEVSDRFVDQK